MQTPRYVHKVHQDRGAFEGERTSGLLPHAQNVSTSKRIRGQAYLHGSRRCQRQQPASMLHSTQYALNAVIEWPAEVAFDVHKALNVFEGQGRPSAPAR